MVRALFPGTFDPIHYGHIDIATRAARLFDEVVMAVYDKPLKSLIFSPDERMALVREAFKDNPRIRVMGYSGLTIDFARKVDAQVLVRGLRMASITDVKLIEKARRRNRYSIRTRICLNPNIPSSPKPSVDSGARAKGM